MYVYDEHDHKIVRERVAQFRGQTERYLNGQLREEEFLPLALTQRRTIPSTQMLTIH